MSSGPLRAPLRAVITLVLSVDFISTSRYPHFARVSSVFVQDFMMAERGGSRKENGSALLRRWGRNQQRPRVAKDQHCNPWTQRAISCNTLSTLSCPLSSDISDDLRSTGWLLPACTQPWMQPHLPQTTSQHPVSPTRLCWPRRSWTAPERLRDATHGRGLFGPQLTILGFRGG